MQQYHHKRVLVRVDLNVPISDGKILDETRINKILPTLNALLKVEAKIILISHFGRPKGVIDPSLSLQVIIPALSAKLGLEVLFCPEIGAKAEEMAKQLKPGQVLMLENLRFYPSETKNDPEFANQLAKLADFYINDAFSCSHRAHASIAKITAFLPSAAGLLLQEEIQNLTKYLASPTHPMMAIVGGSKVSTKLDLLHSLIDKVDYLVIAGAMANTFLKSQGYEIGKSFYEPDLCNTARAILEQASHKSCQIILPQDAIIAEKIGSSEASATVNIANIPLNQMILDIGPNTISHITDLLHQCRTLVWNGPLGVFEYSPFDLGTTNVAKEVAKLTSEQQLISIAGGGDIVAALSKAQVFDKFTYISTAGGAFLEWLEGKELPGLKALGL